jgi:hypothetical protein
MTAITISGLQPGSSYIFKVSVIGGGVNVGSSSNTVTVDTGSLPGRQTVANYQSSPGEGSTTIIQADILVPYAFIRLYI